MAAAPTSDFKIFGLNMWQQIVVALVLGIVVGFALGPDAEIFKVFGTVFIKLIKMVVAPLIFFALIAGITSLTDAHNFKGIAIKGTLAYFATAFLAVSLGILLASIAGIGHGMEPPPGGVLENTSAAGLGDFFNQLIPHNIVNAMSEDHYIQIVVFAVFTGIVMNNIRGATQKVKELNQELAHITFKMIEWIVRLAPLGVFGFIATMVGTTGVDVIVGLMGLVVLVIFACALQYGLFGGMIWVFARMSPMPFYKKMFTTQLMAFSTSSSKATLTTAMRELQDKLGVSRATCNFMMPLGASINMDGTAIYLGICSVFFANMYGIDLTLGDYATLMITCTIGSIGAAGIPSGSIIFMGMVLASVGIPMEGIGLILGVDRILDMFRTTVNITGDSTITLIIDKTEGGLDEAMYKNMEL